MRIEQTADVGLVLEGTYPFVAGGVSSWVDMIIRGLPDLSFSIIHISPRPGFYEKGPLYELPSNVVGVHEVFLSPVAVKRRLKPVAYRVQRMHDALRQWREGDLDAFVTLVDCLQEVGRGRNPLELFQGRESWDSLVEFYRTRATEESFLHFYWTWLHSCIPVIQLLSCEIPRARVYHTACTGFAGLLAAAATLVNKRPMMLTEHGIYAKERRIEINKATWMEPEVQQALFARSRESYFQKYWVKQFEMMSALTYRHASHIYSLYAENNRIQVEDGADASRVERIPNGIDLTRFESGLRLHEERSDSEPFTIAFVGRIAPVKDLMTLLRAARLVADRVDNLKVRIMGPDDEDPGYGQACRRRSEELGLQSVVAFEGRVDTLAQLPHVDVLCLSSISEAQPLVILEAGAVGVPVVSTDVGSCAELLLGRGAEDRAMGPGGLLTPIASPKPLAEALVYLAENREERKRMGRALCRRVRKYYGRDAMIEAYGEVYAKATREGVLV